MNVLEAINKVFLATDQPTIVTGLFSQPEAVRCLQFLNEGIETVWMRIPGDLKPKSSESVTTSAGVQEYTLAVVRPNRVDELYDVALESVLHMASPRQGLENYGSANAPATWYILNNKLMFSPVPLLTKTYIVTGSSVVPTVTLASDLLPYPTEYSDMLVAYAEWRILRFFQEPTAEDSFQRFSKKSDLFIADLFERGPIYIFNTPAPQYSYNDMG